jgi:hypothetical protein
MQWFFLFVWATAFDYSTEEDVNVIALATLTQQIVEGIGEVTQCFRLVLHFEV